MSYIIMLLLRPFFSPSHAQKQKHVACWTFSLTRAMPRFESYENTRTARCCCCCWWSNVVVMPTAVMASDARLMIATNIRTAPPPLPPPVFYRPHKERVPPAAVFVVGATFISEGIRILFSFFGVTIYELFSGPYEKCRGKKTKIWRPERTA